MAGEMLPDPLGTQPPTAGAIGGFGGFPPGTGFEVPGPIGDDPIPLDEVRRIVKAVTKDWIPPSPRTTPPIVVNGSTLAQVADELNALSEWGQAGGVLRTDAVRSGTSPTVTVNIHAGLIKRLPRWTKFAQASTAAKAEWDQMFAKLTIHENRHMEIAIEEAEALAQDLIGVEIGEIPDLVTAANQKMQTRQDQLDADTDHGAKAGVPFGDVILDISIV
jgi:hypothetical protein